ncbi:Hypothetical predicted protein [Cloeon dipterum]|uniref:EGF-like domain-containing protein n=1 Tax=Cloeon dipterum TaxID=197152 RepID=A0A8S1DJF8_9INSE|nr:Hypothetical predicted protein [Cloeon dipterum]
MVKWIATCCALIFLLYNCNFARGYLVSIGAGNEIRGCVTNDHQHAVAFVEKLREGGNEFSLVETSDLDSTANEMRVYDCNLVKRFGCNQWRTENLRIKSNKYENYPAVTDFRWHEFLYQLSSSGFDILMPEYLTMRMGETAHAHFSILTNSSFDFLIGYTEFKDINLKGGGHQWELFSINYSFLDPSQIKISLNSDEKIIPTELGVDVGDEPYYAPAFLCHGLSKVKMHSYYLLVPEKSNAWMERQIEFQKESVFCVDVVYILRSPLKNSEIALNVTFVTEKGEFLNFTEGHPSKEVNTWHVVRFDSLERRFEGKGTLRVTVGPQDLEIGGIRFCEGGGLDVEITLRGMQRCHSLSTHLAPPPVEDAEEEEKFTKLVATKRKICERINEASNCSGMNVCSSTGCFCFLGFTGEDCNTPCGENTFGVDCSEKYVVGKCLNDKFDLENGHCLEACSNSTTGFPSCSTKIWKVKPFVQNASPNSLSLNMSRSLQNVFGFAHVIDVRYRMEKSTWWESKIYFESDGRLFKLEDLEANTEYVITFTVYSKMPQQNLIIAEEVIASTCKPIDESILNIDIDATASAATLAVSDVDKKYCQPTYFNVSEVIGRSPEDKSTIQIRAQEEHQKNLTSCKNGSYFIVSVSDIYQNLVEARLVCTAEKKFFLEDHQLKHACLPINESVVQISFEDQLTVVISSNASFADRKKICKPRVLIVVKSKKILFSANVQGFDFINYFGNCTPGTIYDVILFDEADHKIKVRYSCMTPEQITFRKLVPVVNKIWVRKIELDMDKSLKGVSGSQDIQVQYQEEFVEAWKTKIYKSSMGRRLVLNFLKPETLYVIRLVWISTNQTSVVSKDIETRTKPCIPIDEKTIEMKIMVTFTTEAKVTVRSAKIEELCRLKQMKVTSEDGKVLLDTMVHDWKLSWKLPPCRNGSIYTLSVKDEEGNIVKTDETFFLLDDVDSLEEQRVVVASPSKLVLSVGVVALEAVLLIVSSLFCVVCLCCRQSRRRAHEIEERNQQRYELK